MNILIVDTETTGLDPEKDQIIEIAAILYSVEHKTILMQMSTLLSVNENKAEHINKISANATSGTYNIQQLFVTVFLNLVEKADYLIAHNVVFDKGFLDAYFVEKMGADEFEGKQWICTLSDIEWPLAECNGARLIDVAIAHGVPVVSAHRALTDCLLLASIFDKQSDLKGLLESAFIPRSIYRANVSFDEKELAKEAGFNWNRLIKNAWAKKMTDEQAAKISFSITKVGEA